LCRDTAGATQVALTDYCAACYANETIYPAGWVMLTTEDNEGRVEGTVQNYSASTGPDLNTTHLCFGQQ
jgi:hypothetical protein